MNFKPLGDRVLVKPIVMTEKSRGGIVLPSNTGRYLPKGIVEATGPGKKNSEGKIIPMSVNIGDTVYYSQGVGEILKIDGDEYILLREVGITAKQGGETK